MTFIVYRIICTESRKMYVGITTKGIEHRWKSHVAAAHKKPMAISRAIKKYGADKFIIEQITIAETWEELMLLEQHYIKIYNTLVPNGYNVATGGQGAYERSDETRRKLGDINRGRKQSSATIEKRAAALRGRKRSPEVIKKVRDAMMAAQTPEVIEKIRQANIGRKYTEKTRKNMSNGQKKRFSNPAELEAMSIRFKEIMNRPSVKKKMSDSHKGYKPKPESIEKARPKITKKALERYRDAEFRKKHSDGIKKNWEKRKADKEAYAEFLKKSAENGKKIMAKRKENDPEFNKKQRQYSMIRHRKIDLMKAEVIGNG